ncbi:MAG: hypothetical protein GY716_04025 [bacterium]|nr:hypothetical protein [bacterium]
MMVALLVASAAFAAAPRQTTSDLDDRTVAMPGKSIGIAPKNTDELAPNDALRVGWESFEARRGGRFQVHIDERSGLPTLVKGSGIEWFAPSALAAVELRDVEAAARTFLREEKALLGDHESMLELDREASAEIRRGHWQLVFRQVVDGVRVDEARLDMHVVRGRLVMFGATHWSTPRIDGVPSIGGIEALGALRAHTDRAGDGLTVERAPELVLLPVDAEAGGIEAKVWDGARGRGIGHVLVWRFHMRDTKTGSIWVGEVDADSGILVAFRDETDHASVRGGVFPVANDDDCAHGGCEIARFPMPEGSFTETGQSQTVTDDFGNMQCVDGQADVDVVLSGPHATVVDTCGNLEQDGVCDDGVDLGLKAGENCVVADGASVGNNAAARTSFYHIHRTMEATQLYDPANAWLASPLTINVNQTSTCNATWNGAINMYGSGNGCGNMGENHGILVHEWGHGYDHNDGGGGDEPSEGYADVMAIFAARDSCIGRGWYNDGRVCDGFGNECLSCTGVRDADWAKRSNNVPSTSQNHLVQYCDGGGPFAPCGRQAHCEGVLLAESMYDLAARDLPAAGIDAATSWQIAERLWFTTRLGAGGDMYFCIFPNIYNCGANSLHNKFLAADDDDGNLANGTPHAAAIYAALDRHDLACGSAAAAENQSSSSCPTLSQPVVSLTETPGGTQVGWGAVSGAGEYRVYRSELGCDRHGVGIATLSGGQTSWLDAGVDPDLPRYYRVEALGSNSACSSPVSACMSTPSGARLQMTRHRFVGGTAEAHGFPNPGETAPLAATLLNSGLDAGVAVHGQLSLSDPSQGTITDPSVDWGALPSAMLVESPAPHFEVSVAESVACGDLLHFDLELSASNATTVQRRFSVLLGEAERELVDEVALPIPPETTQPVTATIEIGQEQTISELDVSVDINQNEPPELIVELSSPQGTTVRLHDQSAGTTQYGIQRRYDLDAAPDGPGTMADFVGESVSGTWTLSIQDLGNVSTGDGSLRSWTLHIGVEGSWDCAPAACQDPEPGEVAGVTLERTSNGGSHDLIFGWDALVPVSGYHVLQSTVATFDSGVTEIGQTDSATTTLAVDDPDGPAPSVTYFQVRGVNGCGVEGP